MGSFLFGSVLLLLVSSVTACDRCLRQGKAAYFSSQSVIAGGACGYGSMALGFYGGHVAAASSALYRDGIGCGACFQMRCKDKKLCRKEGIKFIVTDLNKSNETDFVLSSRAFQGMARKDMAPDMKKLGIAGVEYKRILCEYKNQNLSVRVEEGSQRPHYLAIKFLFQGGQTDIMVVDVAQVGSSSWQFMTRKYGAVWVTDRVPAGPLQFRLVVTGGYDGKWVWAEKVLPADWRAGQVYDAGVQITDIAQEGCEICEGDW